MVSARTLCFTLLPILANAQYQLMHEYSGSSFFDRWQFYDNFDNLTNGDVIFVSQQVANTSNLAFINGAGNAVMKVDNSSNVATGGKRNSIRIQTADLYGIGSLWIADIVHVPYGCSVWPAWWSGAPNWPTSGEIDTWEYVNLAADYQSALHTLPGCTLDQNDASFKGLLNSTDCSYATNSNQGCVITNPSNNSYGAGFAAAGGGVFVTEFAEKGVSIWFFSRANIPPSLLNTTANVNTSTLGAPVANYPSSGCDTTKFFEPQHLTFDITLCGDYAGNSAIFAQTCGGSCYDDYVIGPPAAYDTAYFEVKSVRGYHDPSVPIVVPTNSSQPQAPPPVFTKALGSESGGIRDIATQSLGRILGIATLVWGAMAMLV
ncbi:glycoside hydrolase family 16 protein [Ramaria rubella]|nr:glycoside hydrolase family 16 protein [Ramaria rubella]